MTTTAQIDEKGKDLIKKIIDYLTTENILAFVYAEALDNNLAALITVTITQEKLENVPAKRITVLNATEKDKAILKDVVTYMRDEEIESFVYTLNIPDNPLPIQIDVSIQELSQNAEN